MTKLKSLEKHDLPREKLEKYGPKKLKDYELLAILLGSGIRGKNVLTLSKSIIKKIKLVGLYKITLEDIKAIKGAGTAKATQIISLIELSTRLSESKPEILTPEDIWKLCHDFRASKKEHLAVFFLDTQSRLIDKQIISIGTLNRNLIHPREVLEPAITLHASSFVLVHNHPSDSLEPSEEDKRITKRLLEAGELLGVNLDDHVIVTAKSFFSFKAQGSL